MTTTRTPDAIGSAPRDAASSGVLRGTIFPRWLEAGYASLDADGRILQINPALARFLGVAAADASGKLFWPMVGELVPEWQAPLTAFASTGGNFATLQLAMSEPEPRPWFALELMRQAHGCVVRINSALPPASELAEGPWDEN
ncbi:MAG: PAS domain-containing protein, partial [Verrucomicrobia bacterium]|nr:PAS domain-containing protein [Verrucomicrobiota bacterium]